MKHASKHDLLIGGEASPAELEIDGVVLGGVDDLHDICPIILKKSSLHWNPIHSQQSMSN